MATTRSHTVHLDLREQTLLLREVVSLLTWEFGALSNRKWSYLPKLKRRKAVLADRLRKVDWTPTQKNQEPLKKILAKIDQYRDRLEQLKSGQPKSKLAK